MTVSREQLRRLVLTMDIVNGELSQLAKAPPGAWEEGSCALLTQLRERLSHGCVLTAALERLLI